MHRNGRADNGDGGILDANLLRRGVYHATANKSQSRILTGRIVTASGVIIASASAPASAAARESESEQKRQEQQKGDTDVGELPQQRFPHETFLPSELCPYGTRECSWSRSLF